MSKALIIIDFVNDFVSSNGALTCGEPAQAIDSRIASLVDEFSKEGSFVVVASDQHDVSDTYSPEHKLFPPHCIENTDGSALFGATNEAVKQVDNKQLINISKCRYSAFAGTNLDIKLRERNVTDVCLVGVCTDICVLHTAVDAYNLGYNIFVCEDGVASFNADGHKFALAHMKSAMGAAII